MLCDRTALLEWYLLDDYFLVLIVVGHQSEFKVWTSTPEDLQSLKTWVVKYLQAYVQPSRQDWKESLEPLLNELTQILHIKEILAYLPSYCDQLVMIPHRFLHLLPLHALPLVDHTYLLDRFSAGVRYAPSCQLLQLTQDFHPPSFSHLIGIQNPTNDLSFSDLEMDCIRSMFQPHATILPKAEATKTAFSTQDLQSTHCVHFACHGVFDFDTPLRSALVLAGTSVEEIDLEKCLTLGEIFDLNLQQCRLVTLSACETGLTDIRSLGDEYVGLTSGFLYAGSPNIVSSLWTVNDISTAFLMIRFYQNLFEGEFVAVALNKAQKWLRDVSGPELDDWIREHQIPLDLSQMQPTQRVNFKRILKNSSPFQNPLYWAAFCAIGQ